jgi:hypothetical protein
MENKLKYKTDPNNPKVDTFNIKGYCLTLGLRYGKEGLGRIADVRVPVIRV